VLTKSLEKVRRLKDLFESISTVLLSVLFNVLVLNHEHVRGYTTTALS
jgi:hypothetical protein